MQLKRQDNVNYVAIGDNTVDATAPTGTLAVSANLTDGDVVLVDEGNNILEAGDYTALAADRKVRVAQVISLANQEFIFSPAMTKSSITTSVKGHTVADQQVTRIGYNGTSAGSLPSTASETSFFIKIRKNDLDAANRSQPTSLFAQFKTDATGSQEELALGLVKNGIKNMSTQPEGNNGYLKFEALCDKAGGTVIAPTGTFTHLLFKKDSTEVISCDAAGVIDLNKTITGIAAGDCIKIATALTSPVYKVKSVTNGTVTTPGKIVLTYAYQAATAIIAKANARRILAAESAISGFGIQLRGVASDFDVDAFRNYYTNRFTATFSDTSTLNSHITGANDGNGVWQQVAMDEYMSMGNQGQNEQLAVPPKTRTKTYVEGGEYVSLMIESNEEIQGLTAYNKERATVLVYGQRTGAGAILNTPAYHLADALGATLVP